MDCVSFTRRNYQPTANDKKEAIVELQIWKFYFHCGKNKKDFLNVFVNRLLTINTLLMVANKESIEINL